MTVVTFFRRRQRCVTVVIVTLWIVVVVVCYNLGFRESHVLMKRVHEEADSAISAHEAYYISQLEAQDPSDNEFIDTTIADILKKKVRVLCLILTTERFWRNRVRVVNATWARRCNDYYFILSSKTQRHSHHRRPHTIVTQTDDTRDDLVFKVQEALRFAYNNLIDSFDWVLKADDDTYVILENLRFLLSNYDPKEPSYMGFHFNMFLKDYGYMSGGAGYVISKEALRRLVEFGFNVQGACAPTKSKFFSEVSEDFEIGKCLRKTGVKVIGSLDTTEKETFHPYTLFQHLIGRLPDYLQVWANHKPETGARCCSQFSISYHYNTPSSMLLIDHFLYRTSVFGVRWNGNQTGRDVFKIGHVTNMAEPNIVLEEENALQPQTIDKGS